jgi:ABC-type sugar transport system ATPase subunit
VNSEPLLRVEHLSKKFGGLLAVEDASFDLRHEEILAVVGANGAGKSTLIKCIAGAIEADSGTITLAGERVTIPNVAASRRLGIEVVYQELGLVPNMDAAFNLFLGRTPTRFGIFVNRKAMEQRTREVLQSLAITTLRDLSVPVDNLSGGQRQALAIGRALAWGRRIVILDEPAAALGVAETEEVLKLILQLRDRGCSVMVITHNLDHVFKLADRTLVMRNGRSVAELDTKQTSVDDLVKVITTGGV